LRVARQFISNLHKILDIGRKMVTYWIMYIIAATMSFFTVNRRGNFMESSLLFLTALFYISVIGLRHEVGGDWGYYLKLYDLISDMELFEALSVSNPSYSLINWISAKVGGGIYLVNTLCALIVVFFLFRFCKEQPNPWLALAVSVPYFLVVVSMGYTRQSVAIATFMYALSLVSRGRTVAALIWTLVGASFHATALLLSPLLVMITKANLRNLVIALMAIAIGAMLLFYKHIEHFLLLYIEGGLKSEGGLIRVLMNFFAAAILMFFRNRLLTQSEKRIWTYLSVLAFLSVPLVPFFSTAVDRMALYLLPIQILTFSRLPNMFKDPYLAKMVEMLIIAFYGIVLFVWLNYAVHAPAWIPYKIVLGF